MKKEKLTMEYPLEKASENFLWQMIGDPLGLATWFSEEITVNGEEYTFCWNNSPQNAKLLDLVEKQHIQFQWEEDSGTDNYFKLEILTHELSGEISLKVTDFVSEGDEEDTRLLWDKHIDDLKRKAGM